MKMTLPTSVTQDSSPVVAVILCWISKFSFLIPLSYQQHTGKIEFLGFLKFTGLIQRLNPQPWLLNNSNLSRHTCNPPKPASLVYSPSRRPRLWVPCSFEPVTFVLPVYRLHLYNPDIQLSCEQLAKEENRKEYVERKVQIHHYCLPRINKKNTHVLWPTG